MSSTRFLMFWEFYMNSQNMSCQYTGEQKKMIAFQNIKFQLILVHTKLYY